MNKAQRAFLMFVKSWQFNSAVWTTADGREPTGALQVLACRQVSCSALNVRVTAEEFVDIAHCVEPSVHMKDGLRLTDKGRDAVEQPNAR